MARRTSTYKVTLNEEYNNFLIGPKLIFEDKLIFVYKKSGTEIKKEIPTKAVGPYLKLRKFFEYNANDRRNEFKGMFYEVPSEVIFNY